MNGRADRRITTPNTALMHYHRAGKNSAPTLWKESLHMDWKVPYVIKPEQYDKYDKVKV